jgi:hypothetical protein
LLLLFAELKFPLVESECRGLFSKSLSARVTRVAGKFAFTKTGTLANLLAEYDCRLPLKFQKLGGSGLRAGTREAKSFLAATESFSIDVPREPEQKELGSGAQCLVFCRRPSGLVSYLRRLPLRLKGQNEGSVRLMTEV